MKAAANNMFNDFSPWTRRSPESNGILNNNGFNPARFTSETGRKNVTMQKYQYIVDWQIQAEEPEKNSRQESDRPFYF